MFGWAYLKSLWLSYMPILAYFHKLLWIAYQNAYTMFIGKKRSNLSYMSLKPVPSILLFYTSNVSLETHHISEYFTILHHKRFDQDFTPDYFIILHQKHFPLLFYYFTIFPITECFMKQAILLSPSPHVCHNSQWFLYILCFNINAYSL